jgi:hypothetical protein
MKEASDELNRSPGTFIMHVEHNIVRQPSTAAA